MPKPISEDVICLLAVSAGARMGDYPRERRHRLRFWVGRRGTIARADAPTTRPVTVMVREVSLTGVGLVHTERIEVGHVFVLSIPVIGATADDESVVVECRVVRCVRANMGAAFVVGAEFVLLVKATPAGGGRRRRQQGELRRL
jgi:hypothetical protein